MMLVDVRQADERGRLAEAIRVADILVDGNTPRVLPQLGFDEDWFRRNAPRVLRLSLVAFEPPFAELPGLGEHGASLGGLLADPGSYIPREPLPWADPLLGAWAELTIAACIGGRAAGQLVGGSVRLSLEGAAARAQLAPSDCPAICDAAALSQQ
jgi:crotonobetainyl-CoA:carnitine CoA-transferase CaiB-like acyl-CoA transferase